MEKANKKYNPYLLPVFHMNTSFKTILQPLIGRIR